MVLKNCWYVAAFGKDLHAGETLARRICDKPVVLFRADEGRAVALEDRCSHRAMPLSAGGKCLGKTIQCPYHGIEFNEHGVCVKVPGQTSTPPAANIRAYPVVERDGLIWLWPGAPEKADESLIVSYEIHNDPEWVWDSLVFEFDAEHDLVVDNLMDMSHITFVHDAVINGDPDAHTNAEMTVERTNRGVQVIRHMPDTEPPPQYRMGGVLKGRIDRWQEFEFIPGMTRFWTGGMDVGTGAFEGRRIGGVQLRHLHAITPKGPHSCYYHMSLARNFKIDDPELTAKLMEGVRITIDVEDRPVIEAQQASILEEPDRPFVDIRADAGGLQVRRLLKRLKEEELASV
jgi:phenylpropionate dioxygenase-like ring-hydroxylating dioxygenase large terminal subunit